VRKSDKACALSLTAGALGAIAALALGSPAAQADPDAPPPWLPIPLLPGPADQSITTQAAAGDPAAPPADPAPPPAPPTQVQHLSSPTNLPPGTTDAPVEGQSRAGSYLRDLFHAYQTQEISGKDALLLLTQRPMNPNTMPTNGLAPGPQAPGPAAPPPDAPPPDAPPPGPLLPWLAPPPAPPTP
jgi:hypothetical protein